MDVSKDCLSDFNLRLILYKTHSFNSKENRTKLKSKINSLYGSIHNLSVPTVKRGSSNSKMFDKLTLAHLVPPFGVNDLKGSSILCRNFQGRSVTKNKKKQMCLKRRYIANKSFLPRHMQALQFRIPQLNNVYPSFFRASIKTPLFVSLQFLNYEYPNCLRQNCQ